MNLKKIIKDNLIFIVIILIGAAVLFKKDSHIIMPVVSAPDSEIAYTSSDEVLEQSWMSNVKKIEGVELPINAVTDINDVFKMELVFGQDIGQVEVTREVSIPAGSSETISFDMPTVKCPLGTKMWVRFYSMGKSEWEATVPIGTNHETLYMNHTDTGYGAGINFKVIKSNRIFWIFAALFTIISSSFLLMTLFRRKFAECAGLGILLNTLILYIFGMLDRLDVGAYAVIVLSILSFAATILFHNTKILKKDDGQIKYFDSGFVILLVVFMGMFVYYRNTVYTEIDEFVHWGIAVKDMAYFDAFANHSYPVVTLVDYPPFAALYEYFYNFLDVFYSDKMAYMAYHIMTFALLMPIMTKFNRKNKLTTVILCVAMAVLPCFMNEKAVNTIYIDSLLGVEFAYLLICYFMDGLDDRFNCIRIGMAVVALVLTKNMGLLLAGLGILIIVFDYFMLKKDIKKSLIRLFWLLAVMAVVFLSWQVSLGRTYEGNLKPNSHKPIMATVSNADERDPDLFDVGEKTDTSAAEYSQSIVSNVLAILKGDAKEYQLKTIDNFINRFFSGSDVELIGFKISVFGLLLLIFVIGSCIKLTGLYGSDSNRLFCFGISSAVAGLIYFGLLLIFYMAFFVPIESVELKDFIRYSSSFFSGILLTFIYLLSVGVNQQPKASGSVMAMLLATAFLISMPVSTYYDSHAVKAEEANLLYGFDNIAEILRSSAYKGDRAYFVCSNSSSFDKYYFATYVCPMSVSVGSCTPLASQEIYDRMSREWKEEGHSIGYYGSVSAVDDWNLMAHQNEYLFLFHVDEGFKESYADCFENPDEIKDGTIFRPTEQFSKIGEFGFITWK